MWQQIVLSIAFIFFIPHAFCDSTKIQPPKVIPNYQTSTTEGPQSISNEQYPSVVCPLTPSNCPHPGGAPNANCPDFCLALGEVKTKMVNGKEIPISSKAAICPKGYSAINVYESGREVKVMNPPPPEYQFPIPYNNYLLYVSYGWECDAQKNSSGTPITYENRHCGSKYSTAPTSVGTIFNGDGYAKKWITDRTSSQCKSGSDCGGTSGSCDAFFWNYKEVIQDWSYMACTNPGANLYFTGNSIPTKVSCARIIPKFQRVTP